MKAFDPAALDCLAALADEGSFERAAQRLAITQSAVSQRLRALESQAGRVLVVRSRPLRLTEPGKILLRFARQSQAMHADVARELGDEGDAHARLPIAINADSLATWVLSALDPIVQDGLRGGYGLELVVDDQDFTHDWLRQGAVLGCVTTVREALRGCAVQPLGVMRYVAVAGPSLVATLLQGGLNRSNFAQVPFLVFNRKDDMQAQWVSQAFGVNAPRLTARYVPSSEACLDAAAMGWGIGVLPEIHARPLLQSGVLMPLRPDVAVPVSLYWHQWRLGEDALRDAASTALLDRVGAALIAGARESLNSAPESTPSRPSGKAVARRPQRRAGVGP